MTKKAITEEPITEELVAEEPITNTNNELQSISQNISDMKLEDLGGIGPATRKKLKQAGIESVLQLAVALPDELVENIGGSKETAYQYISQARKTLQDNNMVEKEFVPATEALEWRKQILRCTTNSASLDTLLQGGIETQAMTEFYGEFNSGKTQIAHTLCVTCQQSPEENGLGGNALYIDTESTFRPERLVQIAEGKGLDPKEVLQNVVVTKVYNSAHLELIVQSIGKYIEEKNIKLVIVDSIISLHRSEFIGRGTLSNRQQRLNSVLHRLLRIAETYNVAIVVTNQVMSHPDTFFGDPIKAAGGNVLAHSTTYRVYLRRSGKNRKAYMMDSPYHPFSEGVFTITTDGVVDSEKEKKQAATR